MMIGGRWLLDSREVSEVGYGRIVLIGAQIAIGLLVSASLLACGVQILRRRKSARKLAVWWMLGTWILAAIDQYWLLSGMTWPWAWVLFPLVVSTPAWAIVHYRLLRRESWSAQLR